MSGGKRKEKSKVTSEDQLTLDKWYLQSGVHLVKNKPVKRGFFNKQGLPDTERHRTFSSRNNSSTGSALERGIQLYRLWFNYLKLGAELEKQNASVITKNYLWLNENRQQYLVTRQVQKVKIQKNKYDGWDLDEVLNSPFDRWWKTHSYLFEGHTPKIMKSGSNLDPDFLHIKVDPTMKYEDFLAFIKSEVHPKFKKERDQFVIQGRTRPDQLQNRYNALVLTMNGKSAREILDDANGYLRAPDEKGLRSDVGGSVAISENFKDKKKTMKKENYSKVRSRYYFDGVFHLLEVCKGKFGEAPKIAKEKL